MNTSEELSEYLDVATSAVPIRGRSKRGRSQKHANEHKRAQTQVRKRAQKGAKERKREQKGAKERKRALPRKNCKQPGLGTPNYHVKLEFWARLLQKTHLKFRQTLCHPHIL